MDNINAPIKCSHADLQDFRGQGYVDNSSTVLEVGEVAKFNQVIMVPSCPLLTYIFCLWFIVLSMFMACGCCLWLSIVWGIVLYIDHCLCTAPVNCVCKLMHLK